MHQRAVHRPKPPKSGFIR